MESRSESGTRDEDRLYKIKQNMRATLYGSMMTIFYEVRRMINSIDYTVGTKIHIIDFFDLIANYVI